MNLPLPLAKRMKAELIGDLGSVHGVRQILLVSEHEENSVTQLVLQGELGHVSSTVLEFTYHNNKNVLYCLFIRRHRFI